ncbi:MAG TPA: hypothetical protein VL282_05960 [Tepidisphaeraceae bacterium]|jgi:hypothetical protein|nr:hypothetical protein [Tepidisphaeraceae bacterium]
MPETFLILLAGGIMLAAGICDPKAVTLNYLRLAGILALVMFALGAWLAFQPPRERPPIAVFALLAIGILAQLGFVQGGFRRTQRVLATFCFFTALLCGGFVLSPAFPLNPPPMWFMEAALFLGCATIAAMSGIALMDMLLGHAYLTASKMTMAPFVRLNCSLAIAMVASILLTIVAVIIRLRQPEYLFWGRYGLLLITRWLVGLAVPAVFIYMAHDCIKRRATQSATGILYVAGVLIFVGEIVSLYLLRDTRLPF